MIVVLLGTQDKPFPRILKAIDELIEKGILSDEVIAQIGCTKYSSNKIKTYNFLDPDDFNNLIEKADYIISHGGVSSIITALKHNKKVLAIPRLKEFGEHLNNHQIQIIQEFEKKKYLLGLFDISDLSAKLAQLKETEFKKYQSTREGILDRIELFINNMS